MNYKVRFMKTKTTINLDNNIMKIIKQIAINKETTQTKIINEYLKQGIENESDVNKANIRFIVKKNPNKNIDNLIGTIKAPEGFNSVKAVQEIRKKE